MLNILTVRKLALGFALATYGFAQLPPRLDQDACFFDGSSLYVWPSGSKEIRVEAPGFVKPVQTIALPPNVRHVVRSQGFYWTWNLEDNPAEHRVNFASSSDGQHWHSEGSFVQTDGQVPFDFHSIGEGRFLGESFSAFAQDDRASKFALVTRDSKGFYRTERILDMGLSEPFIVQRSKPGGPITMKDVVPISAINPKYKYLHPDFVVHTPDFLVLASGQTGFMWILDKRKESPSLHLVKLFTFVNEKILAKPEQLEWSILGMQPLQDGDVLIASRSEDAVKNARQLFPTPFLNTKLLQDPAHMKQREQNMKDSVEFYPEVCWWKLDPESGVITKADPPMNFPGKLPSLRAMMGFRFRPKLDGNLLIEH